ncbi:MAG TPA: hypothetical protein PLX89_14040 [Verrucomicrobiota bacterium]|nr:hypothetical protein [Verrucomicrobiota bacterium]
MAGVAVGIAWLCGAALRADARLNSPPGLFRGMLHGAMMPMAWPALLVGNDQEVYAANNVGRPYKLGYSLGVNLSGLIFFGWFFLSLNALRSASQRKKPAYTS